MDIGFSELLLILFVALIIWGPRRIPEIARTMGKITRTLRKASSELTTELTREIESEGKERPIPPKPEGQKPDQTAT